MLPMKTSNLFPSSLIANKHVWEIVINDVCIFIVQDSLTQPLSLFCLWSFNTQFESKWNRRELRVVHRPWTRDDPCSCFVNRTWIDPTIIRKQLIKVMKCWYVYSPLPRDGLGSEVPALCKRTKITPNTSLVLQIVA